MVSSSDNAFVGAGGKFWRRWAMICGGFAAVMFASQLMEIRSRSALRGYDNTFNYLWLRSAMVDHDWDFRNDIEQCDTLVPAYRASALALPLTPTGKIPNKYGVGWAFLTLPFYVVADLIVAAGRLLGFWSLPRDGFNAVYQVCIQFGHAFLALVGLYLATRAISQWIGCAVAAATGVTIVWAASALAYYQTVNFSMSHSASFVAVATMAYGIARTQSLPAATWPWAVAGLGWGLAVTTRFQLGVFGLLLVWALWRTAKLKGGIGLAVIWSALGALPFIALQLWAWHVVYGKWLVFGYGGEGESFHWAEPELLNSLFSPWHGLLYWHPFIAVALAGLAWWACVERGIAVIFVLVGIVTIYINAAWWCWWFASAFGNRGFDGALLPAMAGAAWLWKRAGRSWRIALAVAAVSAGIWNFYVVVLYRSGAISRSTPVTWSEMLRAGGEVSSAIRF